MARFQIESCSVLENPSTAEFVLRVKEGEVAAGELFTCYDTHHRVSFKVLSAQPEGSLTRVICEGQLGFNSQFVGAIIDTSAKNRPAAFHYEHDRRSA